MDIKELNPVMMMINLYHCDPGFCTNKRIFNHPYMLYTHKGEGIFIIGGINYILAPGDLFFCPAGVSNIIESSKEDPLILSGIDFYYSQYTEEIIGSDDFSDNKFDPLFATKYNLLSNECHEFFISEMVNTFGSREFFNSEYCNSLLKSFLLNITIKNEFFKVKNPDTSEILKFINNNNEVGSTLTLLSSKFGYHPSTINRIVSKSTGMNAKEYQIAGRIKTAKSLLLYSDKSVSQIALECGYNSVHHFSRQFKNKTGVYPSEFRK